jgi:hypothetical protein
MALQSDVCLCLQALSLSPVRATSQVSLLGQLDGVLWTVPDARQPTCDNLMAHMPGGRSACEVAPSGAQPGRRRRRLGHNPGPARRGRRKNARIFDEEAESQAIGPRRARREESRPPLFPERLPHPLKRLPRPASGCGQRQPHFCQLNHIAQIGDLDARHPMAPDVARQLLRRRQTTLGQVAVPLGPESVLVVG